MSARCSPTGSVLGRRKRPFAAAVLATDLLLAATAGALAQTVTEILPPTPIPPGGFGGFQTPIDTYQGAVYTANVEPPAGPATVLNLVTVVRKGVRGADGAWHWTSTALDPRTADDPWHTQPSLAVDRNGYIHVAYNMHNMPWQYAVSVKPGDIGAFVFRGEAVTDAQMTTLEVQNRDFGKNFGTAAIPGTKVTYPVFAKDRQGELYVSYRFAAKPGRPIQVDQEFAGAIAHYDLAASRWESIGGPIPVTASDGATAGNAPPVTAVTAFAATWGQWVDNFQLFFDRGNAMHAVWDWEDYRLGDNRPSVFAHAVSLDRGKSFQRADGGPLTLPISMASSETVVTTNPGQHATASLVQDSVGRLGYIAVTPGGPYQIYLWQAAQKRWQVSGPSPIGTWVIREDGQGGLLAVGTGPTILRSANGSLSGPWASIYAEKGGWSYPMLAAAPRDKAVYVRVEKCTDFAARHFPGSTPSQGSCQMRILRIGF